LEWESGIEGAIERFCCLQKALRYFKTPNWGWNVSNNKQLWSSQWGDRVRRNDRFDNSAIYESV